MSIACNAVELASDASILVVSQQAHATIRHKLSITAPLDSALNLPPQGLGISGLFWHQTARLHASDIDLATKHEHSCVDLL